MKFIPRNTLHLLAIAITSSFAYANPLDNWMSDLITTGEVVGCMAEITIDGEVVYSNAIGKRSPQEADPLSTNQIIRIFSMTKPIVSVGLMQLVEQKKIRLDDTVSKYIPEFSVTKVYKDGDLISPRREITIRDLLRHTSGLAYAFTAPPQLIEQYATALDHVKTLEEAAKKIASLPLLADPGTEFIYGYSSDVIGRLIEVVSGKTLDIYLRENIFDPLGMGETTFTPNKDLQHMPLMKHGKNGIEIDDEYYASGPGTMANPIFYSGGGGLWSTIHDYTLFAIALERGGELNGKRILEQETITFMTQNQLDPGIDTSKDPMVSRFGLGFNIDSAIETNSGALGEGRWGWCGIASTFFFIDSTQDITAVFGTQLFPEDIFTYMDMYESFHQAALEYAHQIKSDAVRNSE